MESFVGPRFDVPHTARKMRSNNRRPRPNAPTFFDYLDRSPSSTPPSAAVSNDSSDENADFSKGICRKETRVEGETFNKKIRKDDGAFGEFDGRQSKNRSKGGLSARFEQSQNASDVKRCSEGVLAPANWKSISRMKDGFELQSRNPSSNNGRSVDYHSSRQSGATSGGLNRGDSSSLHGNKLRKVKLKVGGVTRTIHAKSTSDIRKQRQKLILQDNSDNNGLPPVQVNDLQGTPWKDFHGGSSDLTLKDSGGRISEANLPEKHSHGSGPTEPVRKSKRVPKRRVLNGAFNDADEDDEIPYLERLKNTKSGVDYGNDSGDNGEETKKWKTSKASKRKLNGGEYDGDDVEEYGSSRKGREGKKKSRLERESEEADYIEEDEEDELGSDVGIEKKRKQGLMVGKRETSLTLRQRALKSGKDASPGANESMIEFPNGLPPAPPRKQKEKLSEVEQQLKRAEAAQRRRMQNEKAALESQKEAIRKILGQDSNRKKREDQLRKRRDELAQEKAANSNIVRWVMGPNGTTVTFSQDVGLPSIFNQKPCSYPPPREKCAGPSCTNAYKYRDSKSKLPLCSLQCYRAIHEMTQTVTTC